MTKKLLPLILIFGIVFTSYTQAQSLEQTLSKLSSTAGTAYVKPVVSAFGSNLNSGWVSQFPAASYLAFHLDLKIVAMGSFFSNDAKNFSTNGQFYFDNTQIDAILRSSGYTPGTVQYNAIFSAMQNKSFDVNFSGPTINGNKNDYLKINFPGQTITASGQSYTVNSKQIDITEVKGFLDELPALPTAAVQLTVGTVYGTNIAFRYFPDTDIKDMGKFTFWGVGAIHNIGVWFPNPLPLDISAGFFVQKMKVGSIFESTATQAGIYVSKTIGSGVSFTPYAGVTTETSKTTVTYNYQSNQAVSGVQIPAAKLSMDLDAENTASAVAGFNLRLSFFNINADFKLAKTSTASAGISFGF